MKGKICLLTDSLSSGGAEKVVANLSFLFHEEGYKVVVFSMRDEIDYSYIGELYNFGLIKKRYSKTKAFIKFFKFFKTNKFDFIIDHRVRKFFLKELVFSKLIFNRSKVVYCIHSYNLRYYFSFLNIKLLSRLPHVKNKQFVSVSKSINDTLIEHLNIKSKVIYNYIDKHQINHLAQESLSRNLYENYIIAIGRLEDYKQFDKLILSYQKSQLPEKGINLIILGSGSEKGKLEKLIIELKLHEKVKLLPFHKNPYGLIKEARGLVLASKYEGFGMVLLESLFLKTPVISFNCKSGPSEIVIDALNGILVEDQNLEKLTLALNEILGPFYNKLKANAHVGLEKFSREQILYDWESLFKSF